MQLTNIFVSFLLAASVSAKGGNKNGTTSVKSQCQQIAKLSSQAELATNDTKLAAKFDNNQTAIDAFKAKTTAKQTELTTLSANTTLMSDCAVIAANEDAVKSCDQIQSWEKDIAAAANDTKLTTKFDVRIDPLHLPREHMLTIDNRATPPRLMRSRPRLQPRPPSLPP